MFGSVLDAGLYFDLPPRSQKVATTLQTTQFNSVLGYYNGNRMWTDAVSRFPPPEPLPTSSTQRIVPEHDRGHLQPDVFEERQHLEGPHLPDSGWADGTLASGPVGSLFWRKL